jgi:hypothetical protein
MEAIKSCKSYAARPAGIGLYENGKHVFKVYYVDIYGRAEPERYEWDLCDRERTTVLEGLGKVGAEGVGFVVSFTHITKVFRFAPSAETVLHVRAYHTDDFSELDLEREEGYSEFACYAEAIIAADEYRFWAEADSVEEYLRRHSEWTDAPIRNHGKLASHFHGQG